MKLMVLLADWVTKTISGVWRRELSKKMVSEVEVVDFAMR